MSILLTLPDTVSICSSLVFDKNNYLYASDMSNSIIYKIDITPAGKKNDTGGWRPGI